VRNNENISSSESFINETIQSLELGTFKIHSENNNNQSTSKCPSLKSKTIVLETKADRDFQDECELFLSNESIHKIVSEKKCCKNKCLSLISGDDRFKGDLRQSYNFVKLMRTSILARSKNDRTAKILELLEGKVIIIICINYYFIFEF
jgi:hypothetical protein